MPANLQKEFEQDDDVQLLYERSSNIIKCGMCSRNLQSMTVKERQEHCNIHFSDQPEAGNSSNGPRKLYLRPKSLSPSSALKRKRQDDDEKDLFWHPSQATPPPANFTPGLIPVLKKALMRSHAKGSTQRACLCCHDAVHVQSQPWDRGWGCGYRNFEMACIPLMEEKRQPMYFPLLDAPIAPGVIRLQTWLEQAWQAGYDPEGADHFKHKLAGTKKWIGTADLYVAFTFRGIPANLIDFDLSTRGPESLVQWIIEYFTQCQPKQTTLNDALWGALPVLVTNKLPIILQHSGHSRTVIGYERCQNGTVNLLMFDPSKAIRPLDLRQLALKTHLSGTGDSFTSPQKEKLSARKLINHVFHSNKEGKASESSPFSDGLSAKHTRAEPQVIVIDDDDVESVPDRNVAISSSDEGHLMQILKLVRVNANTLRKDKYQILYFPVAEPLDDSQRQLRRIVTSMKVS